MTARNTIKFIKNGREKVIKLIKMKKIFIIFLISLIPLIGLGQSWKYSTGSNDFDGKYKIGFIVGTSNNEIYTNPTLIINYFNSTGNTNLYITSVGYTGCTDRQILFKFNKTKKLYKFNNISIDNGSTCYFLDLDSSLIQELKINNYVSVRIINNCGSIDCKFSLNGSTNVLNKVLQDKNKAIKKKSLSYMDIDSTKILFIAAEMPYFPGGTIALQKWIANNIKYPIKAYKNNIQGKVIVRFVVTFNGKIKAAQVIKSDDSLLNNEAIRVITTLPKWIPGKNNNKLVNVWYTVPVYFKLPN